MTIWDKEKYQIDPWLIIQEDVKKFATTIPKVKGGYKKHGAGINMYVSHEVKIAMLALKNKWGCKNWHSFCVILISLLAEDE